MSHLEMILVERGLDREQLSLMRPHFYIEKKRFGTGISDLNSKGGLNLGWS